MPALQDGWDGPARAHEARAGETLTTIAQLYELEPRVLAHLNPGIPLDDPLPQGEIIMVPYE